MFNSHLLKFMILPSLLSLSFCANTEETGDVAKQFTHAINFINNQLGTVESVQTPPPLSDPKTRASYNAVSETMEKFGSASFPVTGLDSMDGVCGPINEAMVKHSFIGTTVLKNQNLAPAQLQQKISRMMTDNVLAYQDELMVLSAAHIHCSAAHIPEMSKFIESLPPSEFTDIRKDGLRKMGRGMINMLFGLATYAADPAMSAANKNQAMAIAIKYAPELIVMTSLADRKSALSKFDAAKPYVPKPYLDRFIKVRDIFTDQSCANLCMRQD
jgi:hypothetical protein